MLNVVLECLRFAYTFLEVLLNYLSKPSLLVHGVLRRRHGHGDTGAVPAHVPTHLAVLYTDRRAISLVSFIFLLAKDNLASIFEPSLQARSTHAGKRTRTSLRSFSPLSKAPRWAVIHLPSLMPVPQRAACRPQFLRTDGGKNLTSCGKVARPHHTNISNIKLRCLCEQWSRGATSTAPEGTDFLLGNSHTLQGRQLTSRSRS